MNWELFAAFLVITAVLVITPGPIVTLVIATGAREGTRAALTTVIGTTLGNAVLLAAIAFGLGDRSRARANVVHAIVAGEAARPLVRRRVDRRRVLAVVGAATGVVRVDGDGDFVVTARMVTSDQPVVKPRAFTIGAHLPIS